MALTCYEPPAGGEGGRGARDGVKGLYLGTYPNLVTHKNLQTQVTRFVLLKSLLQPAGSGFEIRL